MSYHSQATIGAENPGPTAGELLAIKIADAYLDKESARYGTPEHVEASQRLEALAALGKAFRHVLASGHRTKGAIAIALVEADRMASRKFQGYTVTPEEHARANEDYRALHELYEAWRICEAQGLV